MEYSSRDWRPEMTIGALVALACLLPRLAAGTLASRRYRRRRVG
ncbi:hypothetical protein [Streptomyces sp. NPDC087300]